MNNATPFPHNYAGDALKPPPDTARMGKRTTKKAANHLRAWREFRGLSQDELGRLVDTKGNVIGLLEAGERSLSDKWLRRLAPALGTTPGFLLDHDPNDIDPDYLAEVMSVPKEDQARARDMLRLMRRTGTDD